MGDVDHSDNYGSFPEAEEESRVSDNANARMKILSMVVLRDFHRITLFISGVLSCRVIPPVVNSADTRILFPETIVSAIISPMINAK